MNVINTVWNTDIDISKPFNALVKIRYAHKGAQAIITQKNNDFSVVFEKPQMSITSGQSAVFYLNDCIIGGGIIE
jgi:tRNA-specific 2-thiouridylase